MSISAYDLGHYKQIFDRLQYGNVEDSRDDYVSIYEFPINISKMDMASKEEIRAVGQVSEMFSEMIDNSDLPADIREVAESSLKGLADKGYVSAQERYIESLHERGYYEEAYTYANDIANNPVYSLSDEGVLQTDNTTRKMSKYRQNALTDWGRDVVGRISISSDEDMKWPLKDAQKLAEAYPDAGRYDLGFEPEELSGTLYDVAKREEMSPELRESAQASLKKLADKGYPEAQEQYAFLMERQGNYDEAYTYMNKVANNEQVPENRQEIAAANAQDIYLKGCEENFNRLGNKETLNEDLTRCQKFCKKVPDLTNASESEKDLADSAGRSFFYAIKEREMPSNLRDEAESSMRQLADKGYLSAQVKYAELMAEHGNFDEAYTYAQKAAKGISRAENTDDVGKSDGDTLTKVLCSVPELRDEAEASLKQLADKGYFNAQQEYAEMMAERGNFDKASIYANKAANNENFRSDFHPRQVEDMQDEMSKYAHKMYQKHQGNREVPKKENPQVLPPNRDNVKPKPSFKERLVDAGSKGAIGIIKASRAFAQTGLQLADTVLDSGVKMAGAFIDAPDLGIGRGLQGYLSKGIDKTANVSISMIEAARKKAGR